ncbi:MAG: hypothetical protein M1829_000008 [Trizodia sp. TS-e1964]|nr:MAG: hypothetical protein M1829_000008 [Trizodia sp. TS-e1964]
MHRTKRIRIESASKSDGHVSHRPGNNKTGDTLHHTVQSVDDVPASDEPELDQGTQGEQASMELSNFGENTTAHLPAHLPEIDLSAGELELNSKVDQNINNNDDEHGKIDQNTKNNNTAVPDIDFSSAPSDPTDLAMWVATQISNFQNNGPGPSNNNMSPTLPMPSNPQFADDDDPVEEAERERVREENRERKKRWRESNSERNKDNDLRCRINKRAKKLYGPARSPQKDSWMENEFNKRRAKRESKEKVRTYDFDDFPGFSFAPSLGSVLFPAPGVGPQGDTNTAGLLLANALLGVGNNGAGPNIDAAIALKTALEHGAVDPKPFIEALRAMAANTEIMESINSVLGSRYDDFMSGDDEPGPAAAGAGAGTGAGAENSQEAAESLGVGLELDDQSGIIDALNAATAMLNEMNAANNGGLSNGEDSLDQAAAESSSLREANGMEQADTYIDLDSGESDRHLPVSSQPLLSPGQQQHQPDSDISATLQRVIQQVINQTGAKSTSPLLPPPLSPTALHMPQNRALALETLLQHAGMSVNTVMTAAQSRATSALYARLSSQPRTPGSINPARAHVFGSTAAMAQRMRSKPNAYARLLHNVNMGQNEEIVVPRRVMSAEEERKVKSWGFPPLPGQKFKMARRGDSTVE